VQILAELSFDELNAVLVGLQDRIRNESGLVTPQGIRFYEGLHDRLARLCVADDVPLLPAANDARGAA